MNILSDQNDTLYKAAYLTERGYRNGQSPRNVDQQLQQWKNRGGFSEEMFKKRLKDNDLCVEEFNLLLAEKGDPAVKRDLPWIATFYEIIKSKPDEMVNSYKPERNNVFLSFYTPFLTYAEKLLTKRFEEINKTIDRTEIWSETSLLQSILKTLHVKLQSISLKVLISELHIARVTNSLFGDTPEERYQYFVDCYLNDRSNLLEIFRVYPVMARLMVEAVERCVEVHLEALCRFLNDREDICKIIKGNFSVLTGIEGEAGDSHKGGRTVMIFVFASGDRLVYKPRSLAIDDHFQKFLSWINKKGFTYPLLSASVLDRGSYGWQEFVQHRSCQEKEELTRFYYRQGGYIAILYLLRSVDFHHENIIASGEYPILIDLETLFSNHLDLLRDDMDYHKLVEDFHESVLNSIMLPIKSSNSLFDFDVSGLGGAEGQESTKVTTWVLDHIKTDEMRLIKKPVITTARKNRPIFNDKAVEAVDYSEYIVAGFKEMYQLFVNYRDELMDKSGPIWLFSEDTVRHVLRPTHAYARFLDASTHPDYLQDGLDRVQLFDYFWQITNSKPRFKELVSMESRDLLSHDVPYFTFKFNSNSIFDSKENEIPKFYSKSSLQLVMEKCQLLSEEDCQKQMRYIQLSLATLIKKPWFDKEHVEYHWKHHYVKPAGNDENELLLTAAKEIGDHLLKNAIWSDDRKEAYWIGLNADQDENLTLSSLGISLYDGVLGIVLFLAYLERETGEDKYGHLAKAALQGVRELIKKEEYLLSLSAFYGCISIVYTLFHLGVLWNDNELKELASSYLKKIEPLIDQDEVYDLLGGSAGAVIVCVLLYSYNQNPLALDIAEKCGEHLYVYVEKQLQSDGETNHILTGLSHGATGYAWAFSSLASVTRKDKYWKIAKKLLDYERSYFIKEEKNWADLRKNKSSSKNAIYWCHGAPGIGLGRLMMMPLIQDPRIQEEWQVAVEKTLESGFGFSHCLCHGDFGNLDFLQLSAKEFKSKDLEQKIYGMGLQIVRQGLEKGWSLGLHEKAELLGLMLGLSGIGYGILRLLNPKIPSIMALQLPNQDANEM
ncbi:type 2 lanthipeptide synthetase LanM family protein [Paenactinomyces guangxiensis]|uniref:Type 2 lantipeptide synthetase LanM n=1 Tax=Paenactinomyces guangxiensis TaxID=1490290 RepID=A0A7W1WMW2_9BACL|nr:type 2 lanthipeptide synthetase LanM family protein [Paenactinomyces guangxiensis]MBA4492716.1 type 2 lantipeptide synthetase LanM [Paenactinomyces guangxiensis]MBH8590436.1 type 2 lantipeptide synthetase LanM family protein [Paenactinomyces guangxiensis]